MDREIIYGKVVAVLTSALTERELDELYFTMDNDPHDGLFEMIGNHVRARRPDLFGLFDPEEREV